MLFRTTVDQVWHHLRRDEAAARRPNSSVKKWQCCGLTSRYGWFNGKLRDDHYPKLSPVCTESAVCSFPNVVAVCFTSNWQCPVYTAQCILSWYLLSDNLALATRLERVAGQIWNLASLRCFCLNRLSGDRRYPSHSINSINKWYWEYIIIIIIIVMLVYVSSACTTSFVQLRNGSPGPNPV